ncbi:MAG: bifunctional diaminohydroxyphosphoribosylaminopyrimidine deaminase/5-amino-6-(5-phosphoribosylamino)uracil reductase RibD [Acidobacteria bacterium]|nr:bifunctional diaminohydroxyphosphoribosylaminopyrimidine deaminase/5-amino-6-(5-phosphoribosylamino)uracil reductase RibD [Acidobacteriota bacterium]
MSATQDNQWMHRALDLARRGIGLASPNPAVGCVIVDQNGEVIGEGWHEYDLLDHAEVAALKNARKNKDEKSLRGATAYVTLEPCNHTGRTGPCTQALIASGISRVVAAASDPNPNVAGRGMEALRAAGLRTDIGVCAPEARRHNEGFANWIQHRRPFVLMKVAMTLDGRIAPAPGSHAAGKPFWISSKESRAAVQQLRHQADAILTGVGTVLADDPLLTDRSGQRRRRPLLRVILDSALRTPLGSKIVRSVQNDLLILTISNDERRADELRSLGVRVEVLPADRNRVSLPAVLDRIGSEGILSLLTEAGSRLNSALLGESLVDRVQFFVSHQLMGANAIPGFGDLPHPIPFGDMQVEQVGTDLALSSLLRDPWQSS